MPKIAVVIPMRNELSIAEELLRKLTDSLRKNSAQVFILVCDNCDDGSYEFLSSKDYRHEGIVILKNVGTSGYGSASRVGLDFAVVMGLEWAIVIDSDLTNSLIDVSTLGTLILNNSHLVSEQIVIIKGNRFHGLKSTLRSAPFPRIFLTLGANVLSRILTFQISKDPTNGFRAIRLKWYANCLWHEPGFPYILEELYRAVKMNHQVQDFSTVLDLTGALRISSSFSFDKKTAKGYLKYLFLIFCEKVSLKKSKIF